jgi:hypothetical protein
MHAPEVIKGKNEELKAKIREGSCFFGIFFKYFFNNQLKAIIT